MSNATNGTGPECLACGVHNSTVWATARDEEYHSVADVFTYRQCQACGCLFIHPVPRDRLGEIYPSNYYSFSGPGRSPVDRLKSTLDRRLFRSILRDLPGPELRALDVGGGTGWELNLIRSIDPRICVTAIVDIDEPAAATARAAGHHYFCGRIEDYCATEQFDLVLMLNIIEHVDDPAAVLTKIAGLLSPKGMALVKTPNYDSLDGRLFRHRNWAGYHCPRHWVLFKQDGFVALAERAGLSVRRFAYTQGAPFWAGSVVIQFARRNVVAISRERPVLGHPLYRALTPLFAAFDFARRPLSRPSQMFVILGKGSN